MLGTWIGGELEVGLMRKAQKATKFRVRCKSPLPSIAHWHMKLIKKLIDKHGTVCHYSVAKSTLNTDE
jgi:hypothetical protein